MCVCVCDVCRLYDVPDSELIKHWEKTYRFIKEAKYVCCFRANRLPMHVPLTPPVLSCWKCCGSMTHNATGGSWLIRAGTSAHHGEIVPLYFHLPRFPMDTLTPTYIYIANLLLLDLLLGC